MKSMIFTIIAIVSVVHISIAQQKDITLSSTQEGNTMIIYSGNHTNTTHKVTLFVKSQGMKKHKETITKLIPPNDSLVMVTLTAISGQQPKLSTQMQYALSPTKKEKAAIEKLLTRHAYKKGDDINKGIVVFDKSDCPRCDRTTNYLLENNIDFIRVQIPTNTQTKENKAPEELKENRLLLSKKMQENGVFGRYTTPVIMIDGKLTHSHQDLKKFLAGLQKK